MPYARVLIVDDHRPLVTRLAGVASTLGVEALRAYNLQEATDQFDNGPVHGLLLDEYLPDGSGVAWLRERRAHGFRGPVLVCSGSRDRTISGRAFLLGAEFIDKPIETSHLRVFLRRVAAAHGVAQPFLATRVDAFASFHQLTHRQTQILARLVRGETFEEIAGELGITAHTVKDHADAIRSVSGSRTVRDLVTRVRDTSPPGFECEWVDDEDLLH